MRRYTTQDRGPPGEIVIHTIEQLGPNQHTRTNGDLVCYNVPIARIGWLLYGPNEVPVEVGDSGVAYVERLEDDLFNDKTIASFQTCAVTDDHPDDDVTPENWAQLARGFALNVRRGEGADSDVLFADLVITHKDTIKAIKAGKREVSAGYDADYEDLGNGIGRQFNIIGNHVALVDRGRCGPRCAIGDEAYDDQHEEHKMTTRVKVRGSARRVTLDSTRVLAARKRFADAEMELHEAEQESMEQSTGSGNGEFEEKDGGTHIHLHIGEDPTVPDGSESMNDSLTRMRDCPDGSDGGMGQQAFPQDENNPDGNDPVQALHAKVDALAEQVAQLLAKFGGGKPAPGAPDHDEMQGNEGDFEGNEEEEEEEGNEGDDPRMRDSLTDGPESAHPRKDMSKANGDSIEELQENLKDKDTDPTIDRKTKDSAPLQGEYAELLSMAEVLVPGFRMPTFDSKRPRQKTVDAMCAARRKVLDFVYATTDGQAILHSVSGKDSLQLASLDCAATANLFKAAAGAKSLLNNAKTTRDSGRVADTTETQRVPGSPMTPAEINKANAAFWEKHPTMMMSTVH